MTPHMMLTIPDINTQLHGAWIALRIASEAAIPSAPRAMKHKATTNDEISAAAD